MTNRAQLSKELWLSASISYLPPYKNKRIAMTLMPKAPNKYTFLHFLKLLKNFSAELRQTINSYVCLEGQSYEIVFDPVGLVVSRLEGVAILPTLAALPHSPLTSCCYLNVNPTPTASYQCQPGAVMWPCSVSQKAPLPQNYRADSELSSDTMVYT